MYTQNSQLPCFISTFNSLSVVDGSPRVQTVCGQLQFIGGVVTESRSLTQSHTENLTHAEQEEGHCTELSPRRLPRPRCQAQCQGVSPVPTG